MTFNWNEIRYFLAVAEQGSTFAAGRLLRVSQTTVARRIDSLESALGVELFRRHQSGYRLTDAGAAIEQHARGMAQAADRFAVAAQSEGRKTSEVVRLTTGEIFAATLLPPLISELREAHPAIRLEVDSSYEVRDLASGGADIALRVHERLDGADLFGRRIGEDAWTLFCSRSYADVYGRPAGIQDLKDRPIISGGEGGVWRLYRQWLESEGLDDNVVLHNGSLTGLMAAVRAGVGLAVLPCIVADTDPDLLRCIPMRRSGQRGMWLVTHARMRSRPQVRAVLDFLAPRLKRLAMRSEQLDRELGGSGKTPD